MDELDFRRSHWDGISPEAKDFVRTLLSKDHTQRPSALQALQHPWLQGPGASERGKGQRLAMGVVQRIQRYSQGSAFKRSVLDMIAEELMHQGAEEERAVPIGRNAVPIITDPQVSPGPLALGPGLCLLHPCPLLLYRQPEGRREGEERGGKGRGGAVLERALKLGRACRGEKAGRHGNRRSGWCSVHAVLVCLARAQPAGPACPWRAGPAALLLPACPGPICSP